MNIIMIGTGNVATVLGAKLRRVGHNIVQVFGRNEERLSKLVSILDAEPCTEWNKISKDADLYLIAISDKALYELPDTFHCKALTVHTAGSVSKDVLKKISPRYGVLYPLQSMRFNSDPEIEIPILVDANSDTDIGHLVQLASTISDRVAVADDNKRIHLNLAAVIVNNFSNYLFTIAEDYCKHQNVNFSLLLPIIKETANRLQSNPPANMQTGPAIRRDITTIEKHLQLLKDEPQLKKLYNIISDAIMERYNTEEWSVEKKEL